MILLVDNYDSFSYNLYQFLGTLNPDIKVIRNDELTAQEALALKPSHIIISPGPGEPKTSGIIEELIKINKDIPLLGVCLGHQAICEVFGANIIHAPKIMHGKKDNLIIDNTAPIFKGLGDNIDAARYHSLIATNIPDELKVIAKTHDDIVMGVMHKTRKIYGVQFHPESIMTEHGMQILKNFLEVK